ncbi:ureF family protein [Methyloversatilis sp. RAC08]|uniref:urease accessory protein UreF n=1 Tax=Methyloversatilis sp. RAC08 TaxID=1842540 RepID=UPI00083E4BC3|nr:urease accessory UreF family protein [Methyloversatilis sp. RAC08]AOF82783.1 ureF family protein [Methyloversatilis sp. RAC08]
MHIDSGIDQQLAMLQFSDSFFPGGATAFSWGLESLRLDVQVSNAEQVFGLLQAQVSHRWAGLDRPLMQLAHQAFTACGDTPALLDVLCDLDRLCEAMSLTRGWREASRRLGFTQLRMHADLGVACAQRYLETVRGGHAPGHLPVVQGALWAAYRLPAGSCDAMAAGGLCTSIIGAALRMGMIGHVDGQRLLTRMRPVIAGVLSQPPPAREDMSSGTPALDIAAMRHEARSARLFAN